MVTKWPVDSTAYMGNPGALVPFPGGGVSGGSLSVDDGDQYTFQTSAEGTVYAQRRPTANGSARTWSVSLQALPASDYAPMVGLVRGVYGIGPWWWITPDAQAGNLLTPAVSLLDASVTPPTGYTRIGPVHEALEAGGNLLASATWYNAAPGSSWAGIPLSVPVPPGGGWVTFSAWLAGTNAALGMVFQNTAGGQVSTLQRPSPGMTLAGATRVSWSVQITDPSVAQVRFAGVNATHISQPAISWTQSLMPWDVGEGCVAAVPSGLSRALKRIGDEGPFREPSFTVTEVAA